MKTPSPVKFAIAGIGGYAAGIRQGLLKNAAAGAEGATPPVELIAVCDPNPALREKLRAECPDGRIKILERYEDLLAEPIEAVWLPLPIQLHRPFAEQAFKAGKAVMCEKPGAGCIDDLDAMTVARHSANLPGAIGFQASSDTHLLPLKRRMLSGEIGRITSASVWSSSPRNDGYYARNAWAGAMKTDGVWVLDSPANNALSHYIYLPLLLLGDAPHQVAEPVSVEAELYRGRAIENYDTVSMRIQLAGGKSLLVHFTHIGEKHLPPHITIHGSAGKIVYCVQSNDITVFGADGAVRSQETLDADPWQHMLRRFVQDVRRLPADDAALASFQTARAHTAIISGASQAATVKDIPRESLRETTSNNGRFIVATGIEAAFETCARRGQMLHESGLLPWTAPAGKIDLRGYRHFAGPGAGAQR